MSDESSSSPWGKIAIGVVILAGIGGGWSCKGQNGPPEPTPVKIATFSDPDGLEDMKGLLADFEKESGIKTELVFIPWNNYRQKILTQLAAGKAPDVVWLEVGFFGGLQDAGALVELNQYIERDKLDLKAHYQGVVDRFSKNGKVYAIPQDTAPIACLFYNRKMFREAGLEYPHDTWRWKDLVSAAQKLTKRDKDGKVEVYGFKDNYAPDWMANALSNGGLAFDDWRNPTRCLMDQPAFVEGVQFTADLMYKYKVTPSDAMRETIGGTGDDQLLTGRLAMVRTGYWPVSKLRGNKNLDFDMAPFPMGPRAKTHAWPTGGSGWAVTRDAIDKDRSWKVAGFLASEKVQTHNAGRGFTQPSIRKLAESDVFMGISPPANKNFMLTAPDKALYTPVHPKFDQAFDAIMMPKIDLVMAGKKTAAEVMPEVAREVNRFMFGIE